jgi:hypothetical protein
MSGTLFLALASIVGFFFGAKAYMNNKNKWLTHVKEWIRVQRC